MPTVSCDINIYYEDHGKGEPLLLIAGWGTDLTCWQFQIPEFSTKHRVIAFDNRGAGRTDAPDEPYSFRMMADDAVGLLDALGIGQAHILGVSMGGCIAQEIAIGSTPRGQRASFWPLPPPHRRSSPVDAHLAGLDCRHERGRQPKDNGQDAVALRGHQPVL